MGSIKWSRKSSNGSSQTAISWGKGGITQIQNGEENDINKGSDISVFTLVLGILGVVLVVFLAWYLSR
jgi:hypothetical protein